MDDQSQKSGDRYANVGRKSLLQKYLDKNPKLREIMLKTVDQPDSAELEYSDIETVDELIEYACFELTRSKNENLLRGKTFCEYEKAFTHLFEVRAKLATMAQEALVKEELMRRDRTEADAFIKIVLESVASVIEDLTTRKKLSDTIQELYDRYYPEQPAGPANPAESGTGSAVKDEASGEVVPGAQPPLA